MADLGQTYDINQIEDTAPPEFENLPPGDYKAEIVRSIMKPTSNGSGKFLELEMAVIEGEYQNRRIFDRLNLINPSTKAAQIAAQTLKAIGTAVGVEVIPDSDLLHHKPMTVRVVITPGNNGYKAKNEVKGYFKIGAASATRPPSQSATMAKPAAAAPPWRRPA